MSALDTSDATHKNNIPWHAAKLPPLRHECFVHTEMYVGTILVQRCACGGLRGGGRRSQWIDKNARRYSPAERGIM